MYVMPLQRRRSGFAFVLLALALTIACARSEPLHRTGATSSTARQELPFHQGTAEDGTHAADSTEPRLASVLPFKSREQTRVLPSGTLLTVQMARSLSAAKVRSGDTFTAVVAAPLTIDGATLIDRGTAVTGRVEAAQSEADHPDAVPGSGYVRLTLSTMTVEGRQVALQTSSLFARGGFLPANVSSKGVPSARPGVRVQKGRRLTFRLTAPVTLNEPSSSTPPSSAELPPPSSGTR